NAYQNSIAQDTVGDISFILENNGYNVMASTNNHVGSVNQVTSTPSVFNSQTANNNIEFAGLDKEKGDNFVNYLIGAGVGAGLDLVVQGIQIYRGKQNEINWKSVGISGVAGATGVGLTGLLGKVGTTIGGSTTTKILGEVTADAAVSVGTNVAKGQDVTLKGTIQDVTFGQVGGKLASQGTKEIIKNTQTIKNLDIDIANKQKLIDSKKTTRKDARQQQKEQLETIKETKINSVSTKAGIIAGSTTATGANEIMNDK
ncbi:hypothetical protein, partial [Arcobacter sp.]